MLGSLAGLLPTGPASVLIDGAAEQRAVLATRLAAALNASGRACVRLSEGEGDENAEGDAGSWDVVIWLRTAPAGHDGSGDGEDRADIVIDMHNPDWPVIRRVSASLRRPRPVVSHRNPRVLRVPGRHVGHEVRR